MTRSRIPNLDLCFIGRLCHRADWQDEDEALRWVSRRGARREHAARRCSPSDNSDIVSEPQQEIAALPIVKTVEMNYLIDGLQPYDGNPRPQYTPFIPTPSIPAPTS